MQINMRLKAATGGGMRVSGTATLNAARLYYGSFIAGGDSVGDQPPTALAIGPYTAPAIEAYGPIDSTGGTTVNLSGNDAIMSIIAATAGNDIVIPGSVTYMIASSIAVPSGKTLRAATGTTVICKAVSGYADHIFTMAFCNGSAIKNITVDGNWTLRSAIEAATAYGVLVTGGSGNAIEHMEFMNCPSFGIWSYNSNNLTIKYNQFTEVYHPIRIDGNNLSSGGSVTYNNFFNTSAFKSIQALEMLNTRDMNIMHNTFEGIGYQTPTTHGFEGTWGNSIYLYNSTNTLIENNTCNAPYWASCVVGQDTHNTLVQRNLFTRGFSISATPGNLNSFWFEQASAEYCTIRRNIFDGGFLVGDTGGNYPTIEDNRIDSYGVGIDVSFACNHAIIQRNTFNRLAGTNNGIYLWEKTATASDVKVQNNVFNSFNNGIQIQNSGGTGACFGLTITGNSFSACSVNIATNTISVNLATCTIQGTNQSGSVTAGDITLAIYADRLLHAGNWEDAYWLEENPWNTGTLSRGTYTSISGSTWEMTVGVSRIIGTSGEVAGRMAWKFPTGTTEVKAYPAFIKGNKPGYFQSAFWGPAGKPITLTDGTTATSAPSGTTPGSFFPLALPLTSLHAQVAYSHIAVPNGQGHLSFDIWLQNSPTQTQGFSSPPVTHEIMIPLSNWGGYGVHPTGRNPSWYQHDANIDGRLWHVYYAPDFNGSWKFIVFQPNTTSVAPSTLNLSTFINYGLNQTDSATPSTMWIASGSYCVSVELGVEPVDGTGDLMIANYRVFQ